MLPLLGFDEFIGAAPRAQRNILLAGLLVCYERIQLRKSQLVELRRTRSEEWTQNFHALGAYHASCIATCSPTWKLSEPTLLMFMEISMHEHRW